MKFLPFFLLFMATSAFGEIYAWTDGRGAVHYTNRPDEIPVRYRTRAKALNYGDEPVAAAGSPRQIREASSSEGRAAENAAGSPARQNVATPGPDSRTGDLRQPRPEERSRMDSKYRRSR